MQHALVALKYKKSSSYSILNFVISLFGCPLSWMPGAIVRFAPPFCRPLVIVNWNQFK